MVSEICDISKEFKLIKDAVTHPSGMHVEILACLSIRPHSDGFEVAWLDDTCGDLHKDGNYKDFSDADEAVEFFCKKRREMKLGADFEAESAWKIYRETLKKGDKIDLWAGVGGSALKIKGVFIEHQENDCAKVQITDKKWIDQCGWDEPWYYECTHLPDNYWVGYDDYCWSPKGFVKDEDLEGGKELWPKD